MNLLRIDVIYFLRVAKYRCITKLYTSLHRLHVYLILVSITAAVEPCITRMISGASVVWTTLADIAVSTLNFAGIEINLESFNHRNIRSNFKICQKIQGSFISFLTKVLNSVGWIWSIIFSNECWHLIHLLLRTVYGTYSKNYMHFEKLYSCYGTATLTKRSQIEANHQSTQNITSHPSEENYIIVKVVTCF